MLHKILPLFLILSFVSIAKEIPSKPEPARLVNDYVGALSTEEKNMLEAKLVKYNDTTSTQITVVIENSLEDADIFDYSMRLAQGWGIGQQGKNNGILIYVALADRKMRIQVGYGLEAVVTDAACKRIIEEVLKPQFKQGAYYQGLSDASDYIIGLATGQYKAEPVAKKGKGKLGLIFFGVVLLLIIISRFRNRNNNTNYGSGGSGMDLLTGMLLGSALSGGRGRSYGDFSSGGGSFGGFGGGSFGGGGAGGDW